MLEEIWNHGNLMILDERFADDFVGHHQMEEDRGSDGPKNNILPLRTAFPDYHLAVEDEIAEGDKVVIRWTGRGTHTGEFMGIAPTGKQVTFSGISIYRLANCKVIEAWSNSDILGVMQQLGLVQPPQLGKSI